MILGVGPLSDYYVPYVPPSNLNLSAQSDSGLVNLIDLPFTPQYAAEVIAVFLGELAYQNRFNNISQCAVNSKKVLDAVQDVFQKMMSGQEMDAMESGFKAARLIGNELESCEAAPAEVKLLAKWF